MPLKSWPRPVKCEECGGQFRGAGSVCAVCREQPGQRRQSVRRAAMSGPTICEAGDCDEPVRRGIDGKPDTVCSKECAEVVRRMHGSRGEQTPTRAVTSVVVRKPDPDKRLAAAAVAIDQRTPRCLSSECKERAAPSLKGGFRRYCSDRCMWAHHGERRATRRAQMGSQTAMVETERGGAGGMMSEAEVDPAPAPVSIQPKPEATEVFHEVTDARELAAEVAAGAMHSPDIIPGSEPQVDPIWDAHSLLRHLRDALGFIPGAESVTVQITITKDGRITPAAPVFGGER